MAEAVSTVARNLRQLRLDRELSLADLAERSGVAKGTVSALERGLGNPTIETLFALAYALDATLADLVEDSQAEPVLVVRVTDRPLIPGLPLDARLLQRSRHPGVTVELYDMRIHAGADHDAKAHRPGTREGMYVISGEVTTGPKQAPLTLTAGDYASFPADVPHVYRAEQTSHVVLTMMVPIFRG